MCQNKTRIQTEKNSERNRQSFRISVWCRPPFGTGTRRHWWKGHHRCGCTWLTLDRNMCCACSFQSIGWMVCKLPIHKRYCPYIFRPVRDQPSAGAELLAVRTSLPVRKSGCCSAAPEQTVPYCTIGLHEPFCKTFLFTAIVFSTKTYCHTYYTISIVIW